MKITANAFFNGAPDNFSNSYRARWRAFFAPSHKRGHQQFGIAPHTEEIKLHGQEIQQGGGRHEGKGPRPLFM